MGSYIPATEEQKQKMLEAMGLSSTDELFSHIPSQVRLQGKLRIPEGLSEMEVPQPVRKPYFQAYFPGSGRL